MCGNTNSVVGSQCGINGFYPVPVNPCPDGIGIEVVLAAAVFFANHIEMALQTNGFSVFKALGSWFLNDYVTGVVFFITQLMYFCEINDVTRLFSLLFLRVGVS